MHYAALGKSGNCIKYLTQKGIPVNITDAKGNTALHIAVLEKDIDIVKILCQLGIKVNIENDEGLTALDISESLRLNSIQSLLRRYK